MANQINDLGKSNYLIPAAIIIAGIIIAGAVAYNKNPKDNLAQVGQVGQEKDNVVSGNPSDNSPKEFSINQNSNVKGDFNAPITIIEYSDFQCPFCSKFHLTVSQALDGYPGKIRWVYKHFPLDNIHSNARPAAEASECAAEQGKFWEFADGLFENQVSLGNSFYSQLAGQIGLNTGQFNDCVSSRKYKDKVEADYQEGIKNGITGTPGSFINGEKIPGAVPYTSLKTVIDRILSNL